MKLIKSLILLIISISISSCEYINNLTAEGTIIHQKRCLGKISYVIIESSCRINLINNTSDTIQITGYDYLMNGLIIDYYNDTLVINSEYHFLQKSKLTEVTFSGRNLKRITTNAASEIICSENIETPQLYLIMNGSSQYTETNLNITCNSLNLSVYGLNNVGNHIIKGKTDYANYTLEGSISVDALELISRQTNITHKSIGECKVNAQDLLNVKSYSTGNTFYIGTPDIIHERIELPYFTSSGSVIKIN